MPRKYLPVHDIQSILNLYPPNCHPTRIDPLGSAGGMSGAQFWRINAPRGTLILRRWPQEHPTPDRLRFIHAVLHHAAQRDIKILPVPIRATTGESFVYHAGHMWELAPWMPGTADYERAPTVEKLQAAMQALAKFHVAVADFDPNRALQFSVGRQAELPPKTAVPTPSIQRRLSMLQELQSGGAEELSSSITNTIWSDLAPLARQFFAALPTAMPRAISQLAPLADVPLPLQPCLRDIWHDHVLFTGDEVTGIIDFGAIGVDTPATDIARLLGSLGTVPFSPAQSDRSQLQNDEHRCKTAKRGLSPSPGDDDEAEIWNIGLAAYSTIRPLSPDETRAVTALDTSSTVLAACNWLRWIYIERRQFENHAQVVDRFRKIVARLRLR